MHPVHMLRALMKKKKKKNTQSHEAEAFRKFEKESCWEVDCIRCVVNGGCRTAGPLRVAAVILHWECCVHVIFNTDVVMKNVRRNTGSSFREGRTSSQRCSVDVVSNRVFTAGRRKTTYRPDRVGRSQDLTDAYCPLTNNPTLKCTKLPSLAERLFVGAFLRLSKDC
jgi:hypothetical protein